VRGTRRRRSARPPVRPGGRLRPPRLARQEVFDQWNAAGGSPLREHLLEEGTLITLGLTEERISDLRIASSQLRAIEDATGQVLAAAVSAAAPTVSDEGLLWEASRYTIVLTFV
jgi:hypothetical protein